MGFGCGTEPTTLTVFELFTHEDKRVPVVREAVWQCSADLDRVHEAVEQFKKAVAFKPTVRVRDACVPAERLEAFLREASVFRVPVVWLDNDGSVTCDAGSQGFEFFSRDQPPAILRLEWSFDTPPEWKPVLEWYRRLCEFLENCFPGATRQPELANDV
jgi:hypothetical protein